MELLGLCMSLKTQAYLINIGEILHVIVSSVGAKLDVCDAGSRGVSNVKCGVHHRLLWLEFVSSNSSSDTPARFENLLFREG